MMETQDRRIVMARAAMLGGGLPVASSVLIYMLAPSHPLPNVPLHAVVEGLGAFAAFSLAGVLLLMRRGEPEESYHCWLPPALIAMGTLDAFHAASGPGSTFVWLHSTAAAAGGLTAALCWLPRKAAAGSCARIVPAAAGAAALCFAVFSVSFPDLLPAMVAGGAFTPAARGLNVIGGLAFLAAAAHLVRRYQRSGRAELMTFSVLCLLFAAAGIVFPLSELWTPDWWFWHLVRLSACCIAVAHSFVVFRDTQRELAALNVDLEKRVSERTAQLEAMNRELEAFAFSVSHDLRAPLRSIDGFSQLLMDDYAQKLDSRARMFVDSVRTATQRMGELIDALLSLSRSTRGEFQETRVDLSSQVRAILSDLQKGEPGRRVETAIASEVSVTGDERLLRVVMDNLLRNAWKFTARQPDARIEFGVLKRNGGVVLFVRDNGAGFDMSFASRLFVPFQRLHPAEDFPGIGVGLATVQRIIHRHGGTVWAEAQPGHGATFFFSL